MFERPDGTVWLSPPKCGTNTLYRLEGRRLGGWHEKNPDLLEGRRVVMFVRSPVERLLSMWRAMFRSEPSPVPNAIRRMDTRSLAYSLQRKGCEHPADIVDKMQDHNKDWWKPQHWWLDVVCGKAKVLRVSRVEVLWGYADRKGVGKNNSTDAVTEWREPDDRVIEACWRWDPTFMEMFERMPKGWLTT